jgi:hypothetical protein
MENKTVHARMSAIKAELSECKIPKSGKNTFSGFVYHELTDFMPFINKLNAKHGVNTFPKFLQKQGICVLTVINADNERDRYQIVIPFIEAQMLAKGGQPSVVDAIQRMGSTLTYNRRYLYMSAYDIVESDGIDSLPQQPAEPAKTTAAKTETETKKKVETEDQFTKVVEWVQSGKGTLDKAKSMYDFTAVQLEDLQTILNQK